MVKNMKTMMYRYVYEGPVMQFENCIERRWKGETYAPSEKKALSNLAHQYKKAHKLQIGSQINLPGKIKIL